MKLITDVPAINFSKWILNAGLVVFYWNEWIQIWSYYFRVIKSRWMGWVWHVAGVGGEARTGFGGETW